jgi:hypothetical protein
MLKPALARAARAEHSKLSGQADSGNHPSGTTAARKPLILIL